MILERTWLSASMMQDIGLTMEAIESGAEDTYHGYYTRLNLLDLRQFDEEEVLPTGRRILAPMVCTTVNVLLNAPVLVGVACCTVECTVYMYVEITAFSFVACSSWDSSECPGTHS